MKNIVYLIEGPKHTPIFELADPESLEFKAAGSQRVTNAQHINLATMKLTKARPYTRKWPACWMDKSRGYRVISPNSVRVIPEDKLRLLAAIDEKLKDLYEQKRAVAQEAFVAGQVLEIPQPPAPDDSQT
jgi:hypothetical protein